MDPDDDFRDAIRHNNAVFAAFKTHRLQNDMADRLLDANGDLKPFNEWSKEVMPIARHQCRAWLKTEYDTAVLRARQAADWKQFERERDVLPNLKWMPSISLHPGEDHRRFWGVIRPVDDPFWDKHRPGDRWNCKCDLSSTYEPVTPVPGTDGPKDMPHRGLDNNPGKDGALINDSHPYFPNDCRHCVFYKPDRRAFLTSFFENRAKDCYHCPYIDGCIDRVTAKKEIDEKTIELKKQVKELDLMPKLDLQPCKGVLSGNLNRTYKVRNKLLTHCHHDYDVEAAIYIWKHPDDLNFIEPSELGEGKDMSLPKNIENIRHKKEDLHFLKFHKYSFDFKGRTFIVKLALCEKGYEQFYAIYEE